jgi:molecular chaperone GrpE
VVPSDVPPNDPIPDAPDTDEQRAVDESLGDVVDECGEQLDSSADTSPDVERLEGELRQAQLQIARAQADLENYRKRVRRDMAEERKYADLSFLQDLLPVLDNFDIALAAIEPSDTTAGLVEGIKMVKDQLTTVLEKHECRRIEPEGEPFDPNLHEAIAQQPDGDRPQGIVLHVAKAGYRLHDRVIRPAQVVVSSGVPVDQ